MQCSGYLHTRLQTCGFGLSATRDAFALLPGRATALSPGVRPTTSLSRRLKTSRCRVCYRYTVECERIEIKAIVKRILRAWLATDRFVCWRYVALVVSGFSERRQAMHCFKKFELLRSRSSEHPFPPLDSDRSSIMSHPTHPPGESS